MRGEVGVARDAETRWKGEAGRRSSQRGIRGPVEKGNWAGEQTWVVGMRIADNHEDRHIATVT
jgi:hypothetical protein